MNYKETLFFVAKCLTISHEELNKKTVEKILKTNAVDWDNVVKISTAHYVFPALYCNLKRAHFLNYVPDDLVAYMEHITTLNRERNEQIITQAKEVNQLLLTHNITPIFLKGTGNLLEGLYDDSAERMAGDIDLIVAKEFFNKAFEILKEHGYENVLKSDYHYPQFKHQPRLKKENRIAAVEVHKELLIEAYAKEFNYAIISKEILQLNSLHFMSFENQLALSVFAKQINDDGIYYKTIALRNAYDVFLLSKKTDPLNVLNKFDQLFHPLNNFLANCAMVFENVNSIKFKENKETKEYITFFKKSFEKSPSSLKKEVKKTSRILFVKKRLEILKTAMLDKEVRTWLIKRVTDKNWQNEKLIQLGLKKSISNS